MFREPLIEPGCNKHHRAGRRRRRGRPAAHGQPQPGRAPPRPRAPRLVPDRRPGERSPLRRAGRREPPHRDALHHQARVQGLPRVPGEPPARGPGPAQLAAGPLSRRAPADGDRLDAERLPRDVGTQPASDTWSPLAPRRQRGGHGSRRREATRHGARRQGQRPPRPLPRRADAPAAAWDRAGGRRAQRARPAADRHAQDRRARRL